MKRILIILIVTILYSQDFKMEQIYPIERSHSYIGFKIKYMGFGSVRGRFTKFSGSIRFTDQNPEMTSVSMQIDASSLNTENLFRDKDLKSDKWINAIEFPNIIFISKRTEKKDGKLSVIGDLTIHGISNEVVLHIENFSGEQLDTRKDNQITFEASTQINRKEFGIEGTRWGVAVADELKIELDILAKRTNFSNYKNWFRNQKSAHGQIYKIMKSESVRAGLDLFDKLKSDTGKSVNANTLNTVGNAYLKEGLIDESIVIFEYNIKQFQEVADLHDSLAEAYAYKGNFEKSKYHFGIAYKINPMNMNAAEALRHL